jgi:transposase-like protein
MKTKIMYTKNRHDVESQAEGGTQVLKATGVLPSAGELVKMRILPSDPEVPVNKHRRKLTAAYKLNILRQAGACKENGQIGILLRREGLYSSCLTRWRRQREQGILAAIAPQKRGRKSAEKNPLVDEVGQLKKENQQLRKKLWQAERIIEVQKKISEILGFGQNPENSKGNDL